MQEQQVPCTAWVGKTTKLIVPNFARCKTVQVDVKCPQLLISAKAGSALLRHWVRQKEEEEEDVLSAFNEKLCTCQLSSASDGMRHRCYFLVSCLGVFLRIVFVTLLQIQQITWHFSPLSFIIHSFVSSRLRNIIINQLRCSGHYVSVSLSPVT